MSDKLQESRFDKLQKLMKLTEDCFNELSEPMRSLLLNHFRIVKDNFNACLKEREDPLLEAIRSVLRLKQLLEYPTDVGYQHEDEALAVDNMIKKLESVVEEYQNNQKYLT